MTLRTFSFFQARRGLLALLVSITAALAFLIVGASGAQQTVDSRPRQTATPTPQQTSQPTPTPVPQTGPGRRIAPQLGEPPPPPVLKPKPTPTPDPIGAEISENDRLTIDTELVTLHVRVIDRNNHPINNVQKEEFRILEDGVSQPIFSFTREEVPVIYGLAVDTSGSLRPAFEQVINAAKAIINSNKRGDETFLERFISSDKIETIQDFTANKDALMDGLDTLYVEGGQTAVIDDDVSIMQGVTLGGTGKERGDRHPKIRRGVLISAGAKILGNIEIGSCARVAAGSVVLKPVAPNTTVAGIPARVVGSSNCDDEAPARTMDQMFDTPFAGEAI